MNLGEVGFAVKSDLRVGPCLVSVDRYFYRNEHSAPLCVSDDRGATVDMASTRHCLFNFCLHRKFIICWGKV